MMLPKECHLFGTVLQSTGKYEPEHWFHVVLRDHDTYLETYDDNGFNTGRIERVQLDGYKVVPPSAIWDNIYEMMDDLKVVTRRWISNKCKAKHCFNFNEDDSMEEKYCEDCDE